jgi:cytochrome c biogenesis protein ResB
MENMHKTFLSIIVIAVAVGSGAFYGGMKYAENKVQSGRQQRIQQFGGAGTGFRNGESGNRIAGGFASGEILSKDDISIAIKMRDGGSKIIFYSDSTEVDKFVNGVTSDLEIGKNVSVIGSENSDGSITAQAIQLRSFLDPRLAQ